VNGSAGNASKSVRFQEKEALVMTGIYPMQVKK